MKAPFAYYGGKMGLAPKIASLFPPHHTYIEPFFGSGAVLCAKPRSTHEIVNDLDGALVAFWRCLRDQPDELERLCLLTPHARDEFDAADLDDESVGDLERARRFWCRVNQSFAKTAGRRTGWSITTTRNQSVQGSVLNRVERFGRVAERMIGVSIENCDAAGLVRRLATADTVIYADPPYVAKSRNSSGSDYRFDMGGADAHVDLADALRSTDATVFLSGYHSDLYDDLYGDWDLIGWATHTHSSNAVTVDRGTRVEVLWSNRPIDRSSPDGIEPLFEGLL